MIEEDEFDLQELWNIVSKKANMTIAEHDDLKDRLTKLPDSTCEENLSSNQEIFIRSVLPYLFEHGISIAPILVDKMGLSMALKFKYESEPYSPY